MEYGYTISNAERITMCVNSDCPQVGEDLHVVIPKLEIQGDSLSGSEYGKFVCQFCGLEQTFWGNHDPEDTTDYDNANDLAFIDAHSDY